VGKVAISASARVICSAASTSAERCSDRRTSAIYYFVLDQALKAVSEVVDECANVHPRNLCPTFSRVQQRKRVFSRERE